MITDAMVEAALTAHQKATAPNLPPGVTWDWPGVVSEELRRERLAAMRAALEAAERAAWQPIETAPKKGPVDLWLIHSHASPRREPAAYWCNRDPLDPEDKAGCEGWWLPLMEKFAHEIGTATHWRPLPEPPTAEVA